MKAILQRVSNARVDIENKTVGQIEKGFLILLGVENGDEQRDADVLAAKISGLRIFTDENDKMNLSLTDVGGGVLVMSSFTLCADCSHGRRPSFIAAARPETAEPLYEYFCRKMTDNGISRVEKGVFGADMHISAQLSGPVTITLNTETWRKK